MNMLGRMCVQLVLFTTLLSCQPQESHQESQALQQSESMQCRDSFLAMIRDGRVASVNGLSLAAGWKKAYVTIRPDGEESARTAIGEYRCEESGWKGPHAAMAEHGYKDYQPVLSPDGHLLLFTSTRPIDENATADARQNVWYARRTAEGSWLPIGPVNGLESSYWDGHAVLARGNHLYFASEREGGKGMVDIYRVTWAHPDVAEEKLAGIEFSGATSELVNIAALNSEASDNDLYVTPDESLIVFSRYDPESRDIDLFYSLNDNNSGWDSARPIASLNTSEWEMSPSITPDREWLLYYSAGKNRFVAVRLTDHINSPAQ